MFDQSLYVSTQYLYRYSIALVFELSDVRCGIELQELNVICF